SPSLDVVERETWGTRLIIARGAGLLDRFAELFLPDPLRLTLRLRRPCRLPLLIRMDPAPRLGRRWRKALGSRLLLTTCLLWNRWLAGSSCVPARLLESAWLALLKLLSGSVRADACLRCRRPGRRFR